jgi:hypothetical protein
MKIVIAPKPTLLSAKPRPGTQTVPFRNGAFQMVIFPSRESALVLKLGPKTLL